MKCLNCDKEITQVLLNKFNYDGSDTEILLDFSEFDVEENKGIVIIANANWTGYDLTDDERKKTISCPYCKKYPLNLEEEIYTEELVEIICFIK